MLTTTVRELSPDEKERLLKLLPGIYKRIESFVIKLVICFPVSLSPLLIFDHYQPIAAKQQTIYTVFSFLLSLLIVYWLTKKYEGGFSNNIAISHINLLQVEVINVKTNRAIKREEYEDLGLCYYIEVTINGEQKTLFLWGQYLYGLEDHFFPNTAFELIRKAGRGKEDEVIDFKVSGEYFKEERILPAFDKAVLQNENYPINGQILDQDLDTIQ